MLNKLLILKVLIYFGLIKLVSHLCFILKPYNLDLKRKIKLINRY